MMTISRSVGSRVSASLAGAFLAVMVGAPAAAQDNRPLEQAVMEVPAQCLTR